LAFFNLKNGASRKAVIHEYKIEDKSIAQTDPKSTVIFNISMANNQQKAVSGF